jgi:hypothetical protein
MAMVANSITSMGRYILAIFCLLFSLAIMGQSNVPLLERNISVSFQNQPLSAVLDKIAAQSGITFSYSPTLVNTNKIVTVKASNKSVREVLALVLDDNVACKASGKYVILSKAETPGKKVTVSGYVYDKNTGKKVPNTSVYDEKSMTSAVTNQYGYYELEVPRKAPSVKLNVKKNEFSDTTVSLTPIKNQLVEINIEQAPPVSPYIDSLRKNNFQAATDRFFKNAKGFINTVNIKDTISRRFQISFLPYMGTNHLLSANVINRTSINILGGYSLGNNGFEVGGIFNINRRSMAGFQAGGIFNIVGGPAKGFQTGGIFNTVNGSFNGFQTAGTINMVKDTFRGFQASGLINYVGGSMKGFQAAGLVNVTKGKADGFKAAGLFNINADTSRGFNAAGLANISARTYTGAAVAGLFNYSHIHKGGAQIAGLFNYADRLSGTAQIAGLMNIAFRQSGGIQLAGLLNFAADVKGLQLAPFNFSDTCSSGVPIGIASFVRKGVHQLELSGDELLFTTLSFRTGTRHFHNIFSAGISLTDIQSPIWSIGYGAGTSFKLSKRFNLDVDLTYSHLSKGPFNTNVNFLNKLYIGPEFAITRKVRVALGPTFNLFLADATQADYPTLFSTLAPYSFNNYTTTNNLNIKWWIGGKLAFRFF